MSVADRMLEAVSKYGINELDNDLIQVMISIDGTAKKYYPSLQNKARFTSFINDNLDIISKVTFFGFKLDREFKINESTFAEYIYEIRCDILHEGFTKDIIWNGKYIKYENGKYHIPKSVLLGLVIAVLGSKANNNEIINNEIGSKIPSLELWYKDKGIRIPFNQYLGKKDEILKLIQIGLGDPV